jgi:hypothetical protein
MRSASIGCVLAAALVITGAVGGFAHAARPVGSTTSEVQSVGTNGAPPPSLRCKPPDRPRQVWDCSPAPCTAHLVWRCELWCEPGHYPTLADVRANGGRAKCVKHGLP